jgi:hypothetical protein
MPNNLYKDTIQTFYSEHTVLEKENQEYSLIQRIARKYMFLLLIASGELTLTYLWLFVADTEQTVQNESMHQLLFETSQILYHPSQP